MKSFRVFAAALILCALLETTGYLSPEVNAASAQEIQTRTQDALADLRDDVSGVDKILQEAKGLLVFPHVYKGGFVLAGEYGEGTLLIDGKPTDYYNLVSASWGFQAGAQRKSVIIAFMTDEALRKFRDSAGWDLGADASATVVSVGAEGSIDLSRLNKPILVMVTDQRGLMGGVSLKGSKITKISK